MKVLDYEGLVKVVELLRKEIESVKAQLNTVAETYKKEASKEDGEVK